MKICTKSPTWLQKIRYLIGCIFYGEDRPIHVSYGLEQKGKYIDLVMSETWAVGSEKK
jgi:hypothetical protein